MEKAARLCTRVIEYSFYILIFFVPLVLASDTSELFEFNKMWLTFGLTIVIAAAWVSKMVVTKRFAIKRTPLDIPILLFLLSQVIATFHSLDTHVSIWGYYSRFNGGLLSIISYIFLYYAFVSNFLNDHARGGKVISRMLFVSLASAAVVALWGLPSHFGHDPTCMLFRGSFDVSCWTADFQPKIRMFSTLGQPDWLAAYLAILLPLVIAMFFSLFKPKSDHEKMNHVVRSMYYVTKKKIILTTCYILLATVFYADILWTDSRSGVAAVWISVAVFFGSLWFLSRKHKPYAIRHMLYAIVIFAVVTFFVGVPIQQLRFLTFSNLQTKLLKPPTSPASPTGGQKSQTSPTTPAAHVGELGGTDSGKIRSYVWQGALDAWRANPVFGTGVETFAFAYYQYRPAGHNLTSEWNYLYNKAHNEYLNYLTTTGALGLGTYLLMIGWFLYIVIRKLTGNRKPETGNLLTLALISGYLSILITNFFGFSVVIVNIYFFLIPALVFGLLGLEREEWFGFGKNKQDEKARVERINMMQWTVVVFTMLIALYFLSKLLGFYIADKDYGLGSNLDRVGDYQTANDKLRAAVTARGDEPVFQDELSFNDAVIATALFDQKDPKIATAAANQGLQFAQEAKALSDKVVAEHPNNVVFWKTRVRLFFALSQINAQAQTEFLPIALQAIEKANTLAPTDASILYNLGVLYGENGDLEKAIATLNKTVRFKPDYRDAHFALGVFYHELEAQETDAAKKADATQKALDQMNFILQNISPTDKAAQDNLKSWSR